MEKLKRDDERGIYLVTVAGVIVALFFIAGFALESGYLYVNRIRLQRIVDGAVLSGAYYYYELLAADSTGDKTGIRNRVADEMYEHIGANLEALGIPYTPATLIPNPARVSCPGEILPPRPVIRPPVGGVPEHRNSRQITPNSFQVSVCDDGIKVSGKLNVPPMLLGFLPGVVPSTNVASQAEAGLKKGTAVLVIDDSDSMNHPSDPDYFNGNKDPRPIHEAECKAKEVAPYNCKEDCPNMKEEGKEKDPKGFNNQCIITCSDPLYNMKCGRRIQAVKYATKRFIDTLLPGDNFALVKFNNKGLVLVSIRQVKANDTTVSTYAQCNSKYGKSLESPKNCLKLAIDGDLVNGTEDDPQSLGLVSVGHTNIYDGLRLGLEQFEVFHTNPPLLTPTPINMMIVLSDGYPYGANLLEDWEKIYPKKDEGLDLFKDYYLISSVDKKGNPTLDSFPRHYFDPKDNRNRNKDNPRVCFDPENNEDIRFIESLKRQFTAALNIVDRARGSDTALRVFALGLGKEATSVEDEYQEGWTDCKPDDVYKIFLHRLANDKPGSDDATSPTDDPTKWPEFKPAAKDSGDPGTRTYDKSPGYKGEYKHAQTGDDLVPYMTEFGKQLRTYLYE